MDTPTLNKNNQNLKNPPHNSVVEHYLNAINEASHRSRITLLILVTASVLAFAGFWNSMKYSWLRKRIEIAKVANDWFLFHDDSDSLGKSSTQDSLFLSKIYYFNSLKDTTAKLPYGVDLRIPPGIKQEMNNNDSIRLSQILNNIIKDTLLVVQASKFLNNRNINSKRELINLLKSWEKTELENVYLIRVPFFGVTFDINDLGIWSGIAFIIILFMFRFSLAREVKNVKYVFKIAKRFNVLETYYDLMSMYQVFTVPSSKDNDKIKFVGKLPKYLFSLPFLVYSSVSINDIVTYMAGLSISASNTYITIGVSFILLLIIFKSTCSCYKIWNEMNNEWKKQAQNLRIITNT